MTKDTDETRRVIRDEIEREREEREQRDLSPNPLARMAAGYEANNERREQGRREDEGDR
ncbi:MAG: hypothetical protein ACR2LH_10785 [Thermoleophilaceae bacterium]